MKLIYKINLVAVIVLTSVGLAITAVGVSTINRISYQLNREVMSREVNNIIAAIKGAQDGLMENHLAGVLSSRRQAEQDVVAAFKQYFYGKTGQLIIVTGDKEVIRHPPMAAGQHIEMDAIDAMVRTRSGTMEFTYQGLQRFFAYQYYPPWNWLVILSVTNEEMLDARDQFVGQVVMIFMVSLIIGGLIFAWFISRVVGPIRQLAVASAHVSEGKWDTPLPQPKSRDEVAQLTAAFRHMARRLATMYGNLQTNLVQIEHSQHALRESEEKYRGLVELLPLMVYEIDAKGRFLFANRSAMDTFGYTESDFAKGLFVKDISISAEHERIQTSMAAILGGQDVGMMEFTGLRKDQSTFSGIALATAIVSRNQAVGIRGIFMDITERKKLENDLLQARDFLDNILNHVADPVLVTDENHTLVLLNDAFCHFMDRSREQMMGKTVQELFPRKGADGLLAPEDWAVSNRQPRENEVTIADANGQKHVILSKKTVFKDTRGHRYLVEIIKDITGRKKMEQELFKSGKLKSIGSLAGGIAHDFNNILTAIIGNLALAKMLAEPESKLYRRIVASEKASLQAKILTQQLLTFSRGGAPVKQTVSLAHLIEESATFTLHGSNVRCDLSLCDDLWPVDVDAGQINRVIHNLMVNASQAMPTGGVVRISATNEWIQETMPLPLEPGRYVCLMVQDHGSGIPAEILSDIFDPYFTTKAEGSGLGLATAFSIIKRHGGHILATSQPNAGATFTVYLPASEQTEVAVPEVDPEVQTGYGRILVMDDEEVVREVVSEMLLSLGYTCDVAEDGLQAIEKYQQALKDAHPFDVVIMDLTIPGGMGGQETIQRLLKLDAGVRAIVCSGYSNDPVMANHRAYGFLGVIAKPLDMENLSRVLHEVLSN